MSRTAVRQGLEVSARCRRGARARLHVSGIESSRARAHTRRRDCRNRGLPLTPLAATARAGLQSATDVGHSR